MEDPNPISTDSGPTIDDRCLHGLTERTCSYCQGYPPSNYISSSVGLGFIDSLPVDVLHFKNPWLIGD